MMLMVEVRWSFKKIITGKLGAGGGLEKGGGLQHCNCWVMSDSFETSWTVAHQAPLSVRFPRQEYWSGLPFPPPGDLPKPGIKPALFALAGWFFITEPPGKLQIEPLLGTEYQATIYNGMMTSQVFVNPSPDSLKLETHSYSK